MGTLPTVFTFNVGLNGGGLVAGSVFLSMILGFFLCGSLLVPFDRGTSSSSSSVGFARFFGEVFVGFFCAFGRSVVGVASRAEVPPAEGMVDGARFKFILILVELPPGVWGGGEPAGVDLEGVAAFIVDDAFERLPPILSVKRVPPRGGGGCSILSIGQ